MPLQSWCDSTEVQTAIYHIPYRFFTTSSIQASLHWLPLDRRELWEPHISHVHILTTATPHRVTVYVANNAIFYVHKGHYTHQVLAPTTRRELIECPLDAAHYNPNIILLIHERVINANRFAILISFDMKTSVVKFHGCQINQEFTLTTATGQT